MIGTAVHFDGFFTVLLSGDFFPRLYKFEVSMLHKLPELNNYNLDCLKHWHYNYVMQKPHELLAKLINLLS